MVWGSAFRSDQKSPRYALF